MLGSYQERCPYCSFDPTSLNDYCDEHRPGNKIEVKITKEDMEVLKRLRDALPTVGLNGWHLGVTVLNRLIKQA